MNEPPKEDTTSGRKIVLHPKTALARRHDRARTFGSHVRGYTVDTDEVLSLVRTQRRLSFRLLVVLLVPLASLPLVFHFFESSRTWRPFGLLPLPWLLLGPVALFSIVVAAGIHERRSLRIEEDWKNSRLNQ